MKSRRTLKVLAALTTATVATITATSALADPVLSSSTQATNVPGSPESWFGPASQIDRREVMTRLELGYRGSFAPDPGFDPFSDKSFLPEVSLAVTRTIFTAGRFAFAAGFGWDHGSSSDTARGDPTSIEINRLTLPLEGRVHFGRWGYAFARAAPGLAALHADLTDASSPVTLSKTQWLFATDLSAGYSWLVWPRFQRSELVGRLWLQGEAGYGWVAQERLNLGADLPTGSQRQVEGADLGPISMSGAFFRIAGAVSF